MNYILQPSNCSLHLGVYQESIDDKGFPGEFDEVTYLLAEEDTHESEKERLSDSDREWLNMLKVDAHDTYSSHREFCTALWMIKECQLYKETHSSFASFCKDEFEMKHVTERPETPALIKVPKPLSDSIKAFINEDPERVKSMAYLITALATQAPKKD